MAKQVPPNEEELQDEQVEELPPDDPQTFSDKLVASTPWWGISVGVHIVAAIILAFVAISVVNSEEEVEVVIRQTTKPPEEIKVEPPKDLEYAKKTLDNPQKSVQDPVDYKAEESDHNESADNEEFKSRKGESMDMVSDKPFQGQGTYDTIGGGGGGGGRYGGRLGGKKDLIARGGGSKETELGVLAALKWLSRHQNPDGSWSVTGFTSRCGRVKELSGTCTPNQFSGDEEFDVGVTGLSLLAFLGAGYYHGSKDTYDGICFGDVVRNGLKWLIDHQDAEGCIGPRRGEYMYNHLIAALALCEAYGLSASDLFKAPAQKGVDFTVAAQNPGSGWRYSFQSGDSDSSVTGWAAMVLKSAELSGLTFDHKGYDGAKAWYDSVTMSDGYYSVGYVAKVRGKVSIRGVNDQYDHHEALTAIAIMARIFIDKNRNDPKIKNAVPQLTGDVPTWETNKIDFYYWYYASLALFQFDGPSGPEWGKWNGKMKDALVKNQNAKSTGDKYGSWEPCDRWSPKGGRVYATAINALTLEVYYRYASVFGGRG